jgi:hypothetical protein
MYDSIIIRKEISPLKIQEWRFTLIDYKLVLDRYDVLQKESTRHKYFKSISKYDRLNRRNSGLNDWDVPLSEELKKEALENFVSRISVIKWSEFKR